MVIDEQDKQESRLKKSIRKKIRGRHAKSRLATNDTVKQDFKF